MITKLRLKQPTEVIGQAVDFVRGLIVSGKLADGVKLPPTASLARSWGMPVGSAQATLAELAKDGLLVRQPGKGTFVFRQKPQLTTMAIYTMADALANPESGIQRVILAELQRQLTESGIQVRVVIDPRRDVALADPWDPLVRLSRENRVGAGIAACTTHFSLPWLGRLPHVAAFVRDDRMAGQVAADFDQMADVCLQALAEQGCRSAGLMCGLRADAQMPDGSIHQQAAFYRHFTETAGHLGLRVREEWIMPHRKQTILAGQFHAYGYESLRDLWRLSDRPNGLVIYPDSFVPGILLAMAELGVRVPEHIRLAYHRNEQTPVLNPHPATEAILSEREIAAALIAQARRLWKGEPCEPVMVKFRRVDRRQPPRTQVRGLWSKGAATL